MVKIINYPFARLYLKRQNWSKKPYVEVLISFFFFHFFEARPEINLFPLAECF